MVDYKKWDHIEVSDDEDDTHPNIDTPSLFKWRHEARLQREEEMRKKKEAVEAEKRKIEQKQTMQIQYKIKTAKTNIYLSLSLGIIDRDSPCQ